MNSRLSLFLLPLSLFAARGDLVNYSKKAEISSNEHKALCNSFGIDCQKAKTCDIYTFTYETISLNDTLATASGVLIVPEDAKKDTLLTYTHGTIADKNEAPSNLGYHMQLPLSVFAQGSFNVVIPDYLGIGKSSVIFHPFCHASSLATASYDATLAAVSLLQKVQSQKPKQLFVSGYSEGGMAALALHNYIEKHPIKDLTFKASCPMSGPYDLSSSVSFALNSTSARMNTYISYVLASYNRIYPGVLPEFSKVFNKEISYMIPLLFDGCHNFLAINAVLNRVSSLLDQEFVQKSLSSKSPFLEKLKENDTYQFEPKVRLHFIGLEKDTEVGYLNSIRAYNYMKKNKCPVSLESASSELDHMQGSPLCHTKALKFFEENL